MRIRYLLRPAIALGLAVVGGLRWFAHNRQSLHDDDRFRTILKAYNTVTRRIAGSRGSTLGLLTHAGRRSGRLFHTPVAVHPYRDGFLVPLTYGPATDWYRNLSVAGGGTLTWQGRTHQVERPAVVGGPELLRTWPLTSRITLRIMGVHDFVYLQRA